MAKIAIYRQNPKLSAIRSIVGHKKNNKKNNCVCASPTLTPPLSTPRSNFNHVAIILHSHWLRLFCRHGRWPFCQPCICRRHSRPHPVTTAKRHNYIKIYTKKRMSKAIRRLTLTHSPLSPAVRTRLELATPCVTGRYSNRLNYRTSKEVLQVFLTSARRSEHRWFVSRLRVQS